MTDHIKAWGPAAAWAALLFALSSIPGEALAPLPTGGDKVVHAAVYAVLGALLASGRSRSSAAAPPWVLLAIGIVFAVSDEWHQSFVPGRFPSVWDWVADTFGVWSGYGVGSRLWKASGAHSREESS